MRTDRERESGRERGREREGGVKWAWLAKGTKGGPTLLGTALPEMHITGHLWQELQVTEIPQSSHDSLIFSRSQHFFFFFYKSYKCFRQGVLKQLHKEADVHVACLITAGYEPVFIQHQ